MARRTVDRAKSEGLSTRARGARGGTTVGAPARAGKAALLKLERERAYRPSILESGRLGILTGTHVASPRA
eukprot:465575-Pyramimonas_sp.AAC.1